MAQPFLQEPEDGAQNTGEEQREPARADSTSQK